MPTLTADESRERAIDRELAAEQADRDEEARALKRAEHAERERLALAAKERAEQAAAHAAYVERAEAAHTASCKRYRTALDEFVASRLELHALDILLERQGFPGLHLGVELRHARAAPDVDEVTNGLGAAVTRMRKTLGG